MPRANRHFLPGHVRHLTHRCHERAFLFKFARDRNCYLRWLYEARKRFGLCILNYVVTSGIVHIDVTLKGEDKTLHSRYLHVWTNEPQGWTLVARQSTYLPEKK